MAKKVEKPEGEGAFMVTDTLIEWAVEVKHGVLPGDTWLAEVGQDEDLARVYALTTGGTLKRREVLVGEYEDV